MAQTKRISALIELLQLEPHPEGGYFREVFRSPSVVMPNDARSERAALTTIYFLLAQGQYSRVHRVASDEVWHYYEGDPLELLWWDNEWRLVDHRMLGPANGNQLPVAVMPAGCWQAAFPAGEYTLVGCSVAPGFDFADFELLGDNREAAEAFRTAQPAWAHLLQATGHLDRIAIHETRKLERGLTYGEGLRFPLPSRRGILAEVAGPTIVAAGGEQSLNHRAQRQQ